MGRRLDETWHRYDPKAPARLRKAGGLDQLSAAKQAKIAVQTLRYLERGMTVPRADTMAKLAKVYGVDINAFFVIVQRGAAA